MPSRSTRRVFTSLISIELPLQGAPVFAMGNPLDPGLSITVGTNGGILNQTDDSRTLFSGSLNPGMTGVDYQSALALVQRIQEHIQWKP